MTNFWTSEDLTTLRTMWADNIPSAEIGRAINRNADAVTGKARRLGLPKRESPILGSVGIFAEHLASGLSIFDAARKMRLNPAKAKLLFEQICRELGPQAR